TPTASFRSMASYLDTKPCKARATDAADSADDSDLDLSVDAGPRAVGRECRHTFREREREAGAIARREPVPARLLPQRCGDERCVLVERPDLDVEARADAATILCRDAAVDELRKHLGPVDRGHHRGAGFESFFYTLGT